MSSGIGNTKNTSNRNYTQKIFTSLPKVNLQKFGRIPGLAWCVDTNGIENIRNELHILLYGSEDFVKRYDEFRLKVEAFGVNRVNQVIGSLEDNFLIKYNDPQRYIITPFGIDAHEYSLPLATQAIKKQERRKILEVLAKYYNVDTNKQINNQELLSEVKLPQ